MNNPNPEPAIDHVNHGILHPNGSCAHQQWAQDQTLHVAVAYCNPYRFKTRLSLFNDFRRHISSMPNIKLYVGELVYRDRPFEVTSANHPQDFQWRVQDDVLWHKENILNEIVEGFDADWQYGAYIDGDLTFTRNDMGLETIHTLQLHDWAQMFSTYCDLSYDHQPMRIMKSFAQRYVSGELTPEIIKEAKAGAGYAGVGGNGIKLKRGVGATGAAWAFRRKSFDDCGRLLDSCILGSGDWHMAFGLIGEPDQHPQVAEMTKCAKQYADSIKIWQNRAAKSVKKNIGVVNCHMIHHWHGSKQQRGYGTRWKILMDHDFNPYVDIHRDANGFWQLSDDKPGLRDDIRRYFTSRNEDDIGFLPGDTTMGQSV